MKSTETTTQKTTRSKASGLSPLVRGGAKADMAAKNTGTGQTGRPDIGKPDTRTLQTGRLNARFTDGRR